MNGQKILTKIKQNPRQLFLIDFIGALISAFMLGVVLATFESIFGMPKKTLYVLSLMACSYAVYSFLCYFLKVKNWKPFLKIIAIANLLHCCITIGLMIYFQQKITILGFLYFVGEIIIVVALAMIEWKTASE